MPLDTWEVFGLLVFLQLRISCKQKEPIHVFCRPHPNTQVSLKPVLVTVLWDMYRVCTGSSIEGYLSCWLSFSCASCGNKTDNQVMFTSMLDGNMKANRQNGCEPRNEPGSDKKYVRILTPIFSAFKMYTHLNILMIVTSVASVAIVKHRCVRLPFTVC